MVAISLDKKVRCIGVADAHGIESFVDYDDKAEIMLLLRATHNRQRHAVFFDVTLGEYQKVQIDNILKDENNDSRYVEALHLLKAFIAIDCDECTLGGGGDVFTSLELIPNHKLDPWYRS